MESKVIIVQYKSWVRYVITTLFIITAIFYLLIISAFLFEKDYISILFISLFFIIPLKYFESFLVYKLELDKNKGELLLNRTLGVIKIKKYDVLEWGIRKLRVYQRFGYAYAYFIECQLNSGKLIKYQIGEFKSLLNCDLINLTDRLSDLFSSKPKKYQTIGSHHLINFLLPKTYNHLLNFFLI